MRIGIYASIIATERGHERNVSAHAQVPLETARRLRNAGHDVHVITNEFGPDRALPTCMPDHVSVHLVTDGRKRPEQLRGEKGRSGVHPMRLLRQVRQMRRLVRKERLDVLHVFGFLRTGLLAGALRRSGLPAATVWTAVGGDMKRPLRRLERMLAGGLDTIISSTDHTRRQCEVLGLRAQTIRHGVVRNLTDELGDAQPRPRYRVLFWRDPSPANGADLALQAFRTLAPRFPDLSFDFAIRPIWDEVPGIDEAASEFENIHVYRFPYREGISLPLLIAESLLVVMPFRELSVHPQLSIAETIAAGVPVVLTHVGSNPELICSPACGVLVPPDDADAIVDTAQRLLSDRQALLDSGPQASSAFAAEWNWDRYLQELQAVYARIRPGG